MKAEEIIEGNKLIAEFMGATPCKLLIKSIGEMDGYECDEYKLPMDEIEYHSSWDWIIPVVKKIQPIQINWQYKKFIMHAINDLDINTTWLAVVDFIKFYNQQK